MNTAEETITTRFHASLNISDLARSVGFYRVLFGLEPAKQRKDYAKFELDQPPLVLSLIPGRPAPGGNLNHVGLRVRGPEELVQIQHRLEAAGIRTQREEGVECCHSKQTKFWVHDPDRTLWEIYVLHEEDGMEKHDHSAQTAARPNAFANDSAPAAKRTWQHHLTDGPLTHVPHDENSLHEVLLEGSVNLRPGSLNLPQLLRDVHRALRPGGEVRVHGLTADSSLTNSSPALPGPAAVVQYVAAHREVAQALQIAGFVGIHFEQLSEKAHFVVDGIGLRELLLIGRKPGHRPQAKNHSAIFLGPAASITDDFGNSFPRGARVPINIHDWQALKSSADLAQFLLLAPESR